MISSKYQRIVDLMNDPVCALMMQRDQVNPADLLRLLMTIKPVVLSTPPASLPAGHSLAA